MCRESTGQLRQMPIAEGATIEIQAEYTASSMQQHADKAVFSAVFRQTPTDPSIDVYHDDDFSECSGDLSQELSATDWAEGTDAQTCVHAHPPFR